MIIDATKQYQTRDGRKVRILCTDANSDRPVVGLMNIGSCEIMCAWKANGEYVSDCSSDGNDLIPVPEKRRLKGYANIWKCPSHTCVMVFDTEEQAKDNNLHGGAPMTTVDIEYTVGEGL